MSLDAERLQVLKMVEQGQITPAEGARLLEALSRSVEEPAHAPRGDRRLRVRITDAVTGRTKVNIAIPLGLVSVGMRLGAQFAPEELGVDMVDLLRRIEDEGAHGQVADIYDEEGSERVEILVE